MLINNSLHGSSFYFSNPIILLLILLVLANTLISNQIEFKFLGTQTDVSLSNGAVSVV